MNTEHRDPCGSGGLYPCGSGTLRFCFFYMRYSKRFNQNAFLLLMKTLKSGQFTQQKGALHFPAAVPAERGWAGVQWVVRQLLPRWRVERLGVGSGSPTCPFTRGSRGCGRTAAGATTTGEAPALCSAGSPGRWLEPTGPAGSLGARSILAVPASLLMQLSFGGQESAENVSARPDFLNFLQRCLEVFMLNCLNKALGRPALPNLIICSNAGPGRGAVM